MVEVENKYKVYIDNSLVGNLEIKYSVSELKGQTSIIARHKDAREKALKLEELLEGELSGFYVKRSDGWNAVALKIVSLKIK